MDNPYCIVHLHPSLWKILKNKKDQNFNFCYINSTFSHYISFSFFFFLSIIETFVVTVMVRLQVKMGSKGIWWGGNAARAIRSYMEARYSFVQQVRPSFRHSRKLLCLIPSLVYYQLMDPTFGRRLHA